MKQEVTNNKSGILTINFVCNPSRTNRQGLSNIFCAISLAGERVTISLPRKEKPDEFKKAMKSKKASPTKSFCESVRGQLQSLCAQIMQAGYSLSAQRIKDAYMKGFSTSFTLQDAAVEYIKHLEYTKEYDNYVKYRRDINEVMVYIKRTTQMVDIQSDDIEKLQAKILQKYAKGTAAGKLTRMKSMWLYYIKKDKLKANPWADIKIEKPKEKIEIISDADYERLKNKTFTIERLEKVRKLFILQCNCGMSYADLRGLARYDIVEKDGQYYVNKERVKTKVEYMSVILPDGVDVLESVWWDVSNLMLSNEKYNAYLKEIGDICEISLPLHTHLARHYYITHLIKSGIPIPVVAQIVGHSDVKMTMKYTHILTDDVLQATKNLKQSKNIN